MVSASKRPTRAQLMGSLCGLVFAASLMPTVAVAETTRKPAVSPAVSHQIQVGDASWYGKHHQGRRTASGEPFDPMLLTAAHPTLPT